MRLPLPMPADERLAAYIEARYEAATPEERERLEEPVFLRNRDGILAALHFFFQNNPVFFSAGCIITALALLSMTYHGLVSLLG